MAGASVILSSINLKYFLHCDVSKSIFLPTWVNIDTHVHCGYSPDISIVFFFLLSVMMNFWAGPSASYLPFIVQPGGHARSLTVCLTHSPTTKPSELYQDAAYISTMYDRLREAERLKSNWPDTMIWHHHRGGTKDCDTTTPAVHLLSGTCWKTRTHYQGNKVVKRTNGLSRDVTRKYTQPRHSSPQTNYKERTFCEPKLARFVFCLWF